MVNVSVVVTIAVNASNHVQICGRRLSAYLSAACPLSEPNYEIFEPNLVQKTPEANSGYYFIKPLGVADECCVNSCSIETLLSYCPWL